MKFRNIMYIFFMALFLVFAYFLFDRGFNVRTKVFVNYQEDSDVIYKVCLKENEIYSHKCLSQGEKYISSLVNNIDVNYRYNVLFNKDISGYYTYKIIGTLVAYEEDINDSLWKREYILLNDKTEVLNANDLKKIAIKSNVNINYNKYKEELEQFTKDYGIKVSGYLEVKFILDENISFNGIEKLVQDTKDIQLIIPLSYDTFKINVLDDIHNVDSYYDFSTKEDVNYFLLILGAFSLSIGISFLALTIRNMVFSVGKQSSYTKELKRIFSEYSDIIVNIKRFYNKKKYNLIYVDSFDELMDVYRKVGNPISFREIRRNEEAMFILLEDDNAWIYRLIAENK